jgi:hypothetical protein
MAGTLVQTEFVYRSGIPAEAYYFTVVYSSTGGISIRDIQNPYGLIMDPWSQVPRSVSDDMCAATAQVETLMSATSAINGTLVFASENQKSYTFTTPLAGTSYRVQLTCDQFVPLRVINKTTTGFTVQAAATFTGNVGFDVFV